MTIYAGCANEAVGELIDVVVGEIRLMKDAALSDAELRRAKDHLKGSLMLGLESTSSRMSNLARQEMYFDRQYSLDETLQGVEAVTRDDVRRVTEQLFAPAGLAATVLGAVDGLEIPRERLQLG
jgi:predicted Zn-dependent peptidase